MTDNIVLLQYYGGSRCYGTATPSSDIDIRGVYLAPLDFYLTSKSGQPDQLQYFKGEEDVCLYELDKFANLLLKGNPNILEALWVSEEHIIEEHPLFSKFRKISKELLTQECVHAHYNYGLSQLRRMKNHHKWINCKQTEKPLAKDWLKLVQSFDLEKIGISDPLPNIGSALFHYGGDIYGVYELEGYQCWNETTGNIQILPNSERRLLHDRQPYALVKFIRDEYRRAQDLYKGYKDWLTHRNKDRKKLEQASGYDTKHASHLIRLVKTAEEIINKGEIYLPRPDAEFLLDVKNGKFSYEEVVDIANQYQDTIEKGISQLPKITSELRDKVDNIVIEIKREAYEIVT